MYINKAQNVSYIKIIDVGRKIISHRITGYLPSQCVFYLMQIHIKERVIWLTRHGQSLFNVQDRIGGDPDLSKKGMAYSHALAAFFKHPGEHHEQHSDAEFNQTKPIKISATRSVGNLRSLSDLDAHQTPRIKITARHSEGGLRSLSDLRLSAADVSSTSRSPTPEPEKEDEIKPISIWTSTLKRTKYVGQQFDCGEAQVLNIRSLNEIYAGEYEGLTYSEFQAQHPIDWVARQKDKLTFRYPGASGESYLVILY